jgi:hypothetical protein
VLLAEAFFLVAHEDTSGRPRLHSRAVGLGLGSALLAELLLSGHVAWSDGRVVAHRMAHQRPPGDVLLHVVVDRIVAEPAQPLRTWLAALAADAVGQVAVHLTRGGVIRVVGPGRWRRPVRYLPIDSQVAAGPQVRLNWLLIHRQTMTWSVVALAGVCQATGLMPDLIWTDHRMPALAYLAEHLAHARRVLPALVELLEHTEAAVGDAVLTHHS